MADAVGLTWPSSGGVAQRLAVALPYALLAFLIATFALPTGPDYAMVFYVCVIPCTIAALVCGSLPKIDATLLLAIALVVWSGCTLLWGHDDGRRSVAFLRDTLCTLGYVAAMTIVMAEPGWRARLAAVLVPAGAANAILSMVLALLLHPDEPRLIGWGTTKHPILGAASIAVPYLLALHGTLAPSSTPRRRWLHGLAAVVMAAFILFTDSRGPLLAAATATLFLCAAGPWRRFALPGFVVVVGLWWAPSVSWPKFEHASPQPAPQARVEPPPPNWLQPHGAGELAQRGTSHRLQIWSESVRLIGERPVLGHGLADNLHLDVGNGEIVTFPHDLYLSLLFYSGIVGLLLFAALMLTLAWRLVSRRACREFPWMAALLINGLVAGLTDLGQITKGPGPIWIIIWLPALLAMAWSGGPMPGDRGRDVANRSGTERRALDLA